jgi:ribose transport system ATP-binding protein
VAVSVTGLVKSYGARPVLDGVDLYVNDGEIHALLGPNGSGKSTLIRCLSGAVRPDGGTIQVGGVEHRAFTPRQAIAAGTAVIYQNFSLVPSLTVAENVFLGDELRAGPRIDHAAQQAAAGRLLAQFGRPIRPDMPVGRLSAGDRQLVEIAKALHRAPKLLILDEPTAALGEQEAEQLGAHLRRLRDEGLAILYVTHLIGEVFAIADRVTVLRDGQIVLTDDVARVNVAQVIEAISPAAGQRIGTGTRRAALTNAPAALELDQVVVEGVGPASLSLQSGEVLAVFGLLGSGRTELLEGIYGGRVIVSGQLRVGGRAFTGTSPSAALRAGIALVAGERIRQSIFDKMTTMDNMLLPHVGRLSRWFTRRIRTEQAIFHRTARDLRLQPDNPNARAWALSGGNQQKLAVGRWLAALGHIDVLLMDEPTQGIDVGARHDLYELVRRLAHEEGKAIVFTSSDPEETLSLADRVLVLRRGRIVAELAPEGLSEQRILSLAHGAESIRGGVERPIFKVEPST